MNESFGKKEKLKSKILINGLFSEGESVKKFPLRLVFMPITQGKGKNHKIGVSVPKRNFKNAVDRNQIKRHMREAFRKNKHIITTELDKPFALMFIYAGRKKSDYNQLVSTMEIMLNKMIEKVQD